MWIYATMVLSLTISQNLYSMWTRPEVTWFQVGVQIRIHHWLCTKRLRSGSLCRTRSTPSAWRSPASSPSSCAPSATRSATRAYARLTQAVMIYGYSQTVNVFCLLLCAIPNPTLQTFVILYGAVHCSAFLIFTFNTYARLTQRDRLGRRQLALDDLRRHGRRPVHHDPHLQVLLLRQPLQEDRLVTNASCLLLDRPLVFSV